MYKGDIFFSMNVARILTAKWTLPTYFCSAVELPLL